MAKRRGLIAFGVVFFLGFVIYQAPANLVRLAIPEDAPVSLLEPSGTLWRGSGSLLARGTQIGRISWQLAPVTILQGFFGYHLQLNGAGLRLDGQARANPRTAQLDASGEIEAAFVNRLLQQYDITLSGVFTLDAVTATLQAGTITAADGSLSWSGGPVRYVLSGRLWESELPELIADLGPGPVAEVFPRGGQTPVLKAELLDNGFARVGMTKLLTILLSNPWPGGDPDHAVVLEVEEQVF